MNNNNVNNNKFFNTYDIPTMNPTISEHQRATSTASTTAWPARGGGDAGGLQVGLRLGIMKRDFFESSMGMKRAPRCQVEGCAAALAAAKEYHRRHKVCKFHAKAPTVIVNGLLQRFCQQCSRFHDVAEFDDAKRSCRRRLAGHNERRRKTAHVSLSPSSSNPNFHGQRDALSLLSSKPAKETRVSSSHDFSSTSTTAAAAFRQLIHENRTATALAAHLRLNNGIGSHRPHHHHASSSSSMDTMMINSSFYEGPSSSSSSRMIMPRHHHCHVDGWDECRGKEGDDDGDQQVTLDLMQAYGVVE